MSWVPVLWHILLGLLAAWAWFLLGVPRDAAIPLWRRAVSFLLLTLLASVTMSFVAPYVFLDKTALLPELPAMVTALRIACCAGLGLAAWALLLPRQAAAGLALGVLSGGLGLAGYHWLVCARAWKILGWFCGPFTEAVLAPILAASAVFAGLILVGDDWKPARFRILPALLLLWTIPPALTRWRLESAWGYGPASLARAAGVPPAAEAEKAAVAWLRPFGDKSYRLDEVPVAAASLDASAESLERLEAFLNIRRFRHLFWREGVEVLRRGWLSRWDSQRALDAALLREEGLFAPDYRSALALLRAGPVTIERYQRLVALSESTGERREGFESVNQSQLIYEAFSAAYARFGDEEGAREWLYRVDRLWPIYDKKIEAAPLESFHEGEIEGWVLVDGKPAGDLRVGLFFVASSSAPAGILSSSQLPDENGRFHFSRLGTGSYYLALRGAPARLRGRIASTPGLVVLSAEEPAAVLNAVRVERSGESVEEGPQPLHDLERYSVPALEAPQPSFKPRPR